MKRHTHISHLLLYMSILICFGMSSCKEEPFEVKATPITLSINNIEDTTVTEKGIYITTMGDTTIAAGQAYLIVSSTYATIVIEPEAINNTPQFYIPPSFTKRSGVVNYSLYLNDKVTQEGSFRLLPNPTQLGTVETYLGPRSIVANVRDYTMLVSIPTDTLDNTLPDNTEVALKSQFKSNITTTSHELTSGFVWKRIYAPLKTGRVSTGSTIENISSKELVADVFPDVAQDFTITASSNHNYADGNEIITFNSSQIRDAHGNVMTDGTLVTFFMTNARGAHWQITASTINGYAFAKALHPHFPTTWNVRAAATGIAQSKSITQEFTAIIDSIPAPQITERNLTVGPLTSYLGQLVQNGIDVQITVNNNTYNGLTKNGSAVFYLKEEDYPAGTYDVNIETLGLEATYKITITD